MTLSLSRAPTVIHTLGAVRSNQFVRIVQQVGALQTRAVQRTWSLFDPEREVDMSTAVQLLLLSPELLDRLEARAGCANAAFDTPSPLDTVVSLGEAALIALHAADSLAIASKPPQKPGKRNDMFCFRLYASKHRDASSTPYMQIEVSSLLDGVKALHRTVAATLYLTGEAHHCPNLVLDELKPQIRGILGRSRIIGTASGIAFAQHMEPQDLAREVAERLLSSVTVP